MVDEKSLDTEGRWPWPRAKLARLVDALSRDGAKVIASTSRSRSPTEAPASSSLDRVRDTVGALGLSSPRLETLLDESRRSATTTGAGACAPGVAAATVLATSSSMTEADHHVDETKIERELELIAPSKYAARRLPDARGGGRSAVRA